MDAAACRNEAWSSTSRTPISSSGSSGCLFRGVSNRTLVPLPGSLSIFRSPLSARALSRIPLVPIPAGDHSDRLKPRPRSEEHTSELQSHSDLVCRLLLEKKKKQLSQMCTTNLKRKYC